MCSANLSISLRYSSMVIAYASDCFLLRLNAQKRQASTQMFVWLIWTFELKKTCLSNLECFTKLASIPTSLILGCWYSIRPSSMLSRFPLASFVAIGSTAFDHCLSIREILSFSLQLAALPAFCIDADHSVIYFGLSHTSNIYVHHLRYIFDSKKFRIDY